MVELSTRAALEALRLLNDWLLNFAKGNGQEESISVKRAQVAAQEIRADLAREGQITSELLDDAANAWYKGTLLDVRAYQSTQYTPDEVANMREFRISSDSGLLGRVHDYQDKHRDETSTQQKDYPIRWCVDVFEVISGKWYTVCAFRNYIDAWHYRSHTTAQFASKCRLRNGLPVGYDWVTGNKEEPVAEPAPAETGLDPSPETHDAPGKSDGSPNPDANEMKFVLTPAFNPVGKWSDGPVTVRFDAPLDVESIITGIWDRSKIENAAQAMKDHIKKEGSVSNNNVSVKCTAVGTAKESRPTTVSDATAEQAVAIASLMTYVENLTLQLEPVLRTVAEPIVGASLLAADTSPAVRNIQDNTQLIYEASSDLSRLLGRIAV